jgi:hypothetical protein
MGRNENFRTSLFSILSFLLIGIISLPVSAQTWTGSYSILESNPQPGDAVTLIVSVGDASNQVSSQAGITVTIPYNSDMLAPEGTQEIDAGNSFFVGSNQFTYSLEINESTNEITLGIDLCSPATGSGYGEIARVRGLVVIDDLLKKPLQEAKTANSEPVIYPNPTQGNLNIDFPGHGPGTAQLYSFSGQLVLEKRWSNDLTTVAMNVEHLPAGQYWMRVSTEGTSWSKAVQIR